MYIGGRKAGAGDRGRGTDSDRDRNRDRDRRTDGRTGQDRLDRTGQDRTGQDGQDRQTHIQTEHGCLLQETSKLQAELQKAKEALEELLRLSLNSLRLS